MTALLIGLRSAVIIFNLAMLMSYACSKLPDAPGDRLGPYGWIAISGAVTPGATSDLVLTESGTRD